MRATASETINILLLAGTASASANWGGAQMAGSGVNAVSGVVTVPTVSIPPGGSSSTRWGGNAWVGIDGNASPCDGLLQTGIEWNIIDGVPKYIAWYEWYPNEDVVQISSVTVSPGDVIGMKVVATSSSSGSIYIVNHSTGHSYEEHFSGFSSHPLCQTHGEWIVEDFSVNHEPVAFADFTPVTFTDCSLTDSAGTHDLDDAYNETLERDGKVYATCHVAGSSTVDCQYGE